MSHSDEPKEFLWNSHSYLNEYIRFADTKAEMVIGWTSALIGLLFASDFHHHLFQSDIASIVATLGLIILVFAFGFAFKAVMPRLGTTQKPGFIFWRNVLNHKSKEDYVASVKALTPDEQNEQVAQHLHDLSAVCDRKFWWVNYSIYLAFFGSVVCGIMFLWFDKHPDKKNEDPPVQQNATTHREPENSSTLASRIATKHCTEKIYGPLTVR